MDEKSKPRWVYRFDNYSRAFKLLSEGVELACSRDLSQLEKEGIIQRFEYCWELAWKCLKDYLEFSGINLPTITPAAVIKAAFAANIITEGETWMRALDVRNKMSHTYNLKDFETAINEIKADYIRIFNQAYGFLDNAAKQRP